MDARQLTIALEDESHGYAISPERVPLSVLTTFPAQVQSFIRGSDKEVNAASLEVAIVKGSFALQTAPVYAPALFHDLSLLSSARGDLSDIDPKRRSVLEEWQSAAKQQISRVVKIVAPGIGRVQIDHQTQFTFQSDVWVDVERYIQGELMDLGGIKSSNAHIRLPDGSKLVVRTDKDLIRAEKQNKVYQPVNVRIKAKYNIRTGELRDSVLVEFVEYAPRFDKEQFLKAVENGDKAWADVTDPAAWVRDMRGHGE